MRPALLDINVLIALLDDLHVHHQSAQRWFASVKSSGWATCPITQNGLVRIVSHKAYGGSFLPRDIAHILQDLIADEHHRFWPDSIALFDSAHCDLERLTSSRQITDTYLLALAKANDGVLATFDSRLIVDAVPDGAAHLFTIPTA